MLWQSVEDWELIVVGDACTDDTEDVVAGFGDPRIRFVNLKENCGEQSGPNNEGIRLARGRFVAFLNHDDLWLPDHLEVLVEAIGELDADLVFSLLAHVGEDGPDKLWGAGPTDRFEPWMYAPVSAWLVRRETAVEVGPFRPARECHTIPQQDWLYRVWRRGRRIRLIPRLTGVAMPSSVRPLAYARRDEDVQHEYFRRIRAEPDFRERELTALALRHAIWQDAPKPLVRHAVWAGYDAMRRGAMAAGVNPWAALRLLQHRRRGGFLDQVRHRRGLPPLPRHTVGRR